MSEATLTPSLNSAGRSAAAASSIAIVPAGVSAAGVPAAQPVSAKTLTVASIAKPANLEMLNCSPIGIYKKSLVGRSAKSGSIWPIFTRSKQEKPLEGYKTLLIKALVRAF
jgi:hypothetical protein